MSSLSPSSVAFHISMNVSNIDRSVEFFSKVFGAPPAKHRRDYAKFELTNPPITFSLEPISPTERGALNHVGFKFESSAELVEVQRRLEMAGIRSEREEGVECCYSKQTKFWLHDPDGTLWEMYVLEGDIDHRGAGQSEKSVTGDRPADAYKSGSHSLVPIACSTNGNGAAKQTWSHRLGQPLTIPSDIVRESLDEAALQGSFNAADTLPNVRRFLHEVSERLKPGGRVSIHCLTADRHVDEVPALPGPASVVKSVPCLDSLIDHLEAAGFEAIRLMKYGSRACFTAGDAELRETMIEAFRPAANDSETVAVVYKGPLAAITLDDGTVLKAGRRAEVSRSLAERLQSTSPDSFVVVEAATSPVSCTSS